MTSLMRTKTSIVVLALGIGYVEGWLLQLDARCTHRDSGNSWGWILDVGHAVCCLLRIWTSHMLEWSCVSCAIWCVPHDFILLSFMQGVSCLYLWTVVHHYSNYGGKVQLPPTSLSLHDRAIPSRTAVVIPCFLRRRLLSGRHVCRVVSISILFSLSTICIHIGKKNNSSSIIINILTASVHHWRGCWE